ncbi:hypothetical protein, partial [Acinetobacter baumannii]|uniref:hypothetical protein n=1 Tax=Acinetobacter baumannii TaxID=470 RepID=UPI001C0A3D4A
LGQSKSGPAGTKALNQAIERIWLVNQPRISAWGLAVGSKVLWLRNDYDKAPERDSDGRIVVDPVTGKPTCAGFM